MKGKNLPNNANQAELESCVFIGVGCAGEGYKATTALRQPFQTAYFWALSGRVEKPKVFYTGRLSRNVVELKLLRCYRKSAGIVKVSVAEQERIEADEASVSWLKIRYKDYVNKSGWASSGFWDYSRSEVERPRGGRDGEEGGER